MTEPPMQPFQDRNVLVTGAASGIGRLLARRFHAAGARVIAWDVDEAGLASLAAELGDARLLPQRCDLQDRDDVRRQAEQALARAGPVDVLVNNAGVVSGKPLLAASDEEIERTLRINTLALFWTTRAFLPAMLERDRGTVVTISSAAGLVGVARLTDYCASKWAAVGFDESLRAELRKQGASVRTLVVCPYFVDTGMFDGARTRFPRLLPILAPEWVAERIVAAVADGRRRLLLPRFVWATLAARLLPVRAFDAVTGFFGLDRSMDEFKGRDRGPGHPRR